MSARANFWSGLGHQLKSPSGAGGRLMGRVMTVVNSGPNRLAIGALDLQPDDTVLELGFGPGCAIEAMAKAATRGLVLGIDSSPDMLAQAERRNRRAIEEGRVHLRLGQFGELPWPSGFMGKILAVNVAYFFSESGDEIREARRVLAPGGLMAVYATHKDTMQHWKFAGPDTHRLYGAAELRALLLRGGFEPQEVTVREVALAFGVRGLLALAALPAAQAGERRR